MLNTASSNSGTIWPLVKVPKSPPASLDGQVEWADAAASKVISLLFILFNISLANSSESTNICLADADSGLLNLDLLASKKAFFSSSVSVTLDKTLFIAYCFNIFSSIFFISALKSSSLCSWSSLACI